jgi:class 3 adenylate cyclase
MIADRASYPRGRGLVSSRTALPSGFVTFLFTDIEGSTRLARMLGDQYGHVLADHRRIIRDSLPPESVELFTGGESFFVAFSDAAAAIAFCVTAQRKLAAYSWPNGIGLRVRMGMHTGEARPVGGEYSSLHVHRAARVAAAAHGGQVLCSAGTARHAPNLPRDVTLRDLGGHRLRPFDDSEHLYQVVSPGLAEDFPKPRTPASAVRDTEPNLFEMLRPGKTIDADRVFLCHSSGDKDEVRALFQRLKTDGVACWFDEDELRPGQNWDFEIRSAIRRAKYVLAILSQNSIAKTGYVQKELKRALDVADEQPEGSVFLIPVRLEECDVPERLRHLHWVDLFRDPLEYFRLLRALRS